jgi:orotate phosphoribosyltransferase
MARDEAVRVSFDAPDPRITALKGVAAYHPSYKRGMFDRREFLRVLDLLEYEVPRKMHEWKAEAVAVTGTSGVAIAWGLLARIDFPIIHIRKRGESSHGSMIEAPNNMRRPRQYLILDDFVCTGESVSKIIRELEPYAKCVGFIGYHGNKSSTDHHIEAIRNFTEQYIPVHNLGSCHSIE